MPEGAFPGETRPRGFKSTQQGLDDGHQMSAYVLALVFLGNGETANFDGRITAELLAVRKRILDFLPLTSDNLQPCHLVI